MAACSHPRPLSADVFDEVCRAMLAYVGADRSFLDCHTGDVLWVPEGAWAVAATGRPPEGLGERRRELCTKREYVETAHRITEDRWERFAEIPGLGREWHYGLITRFAETLGDRRLAELLRATVEDELVVYRIERLIWKVDRLEHARYMAMLREAVSREAAAWLTTLGFALPEE